MYLKRICFLLAMLLLSATAFAAPTVPAPNMVTMVDIGSKNCIPCKMMAPILEKLEKDYEGKAAIVFIDIREDVSQAQKYGIRTIPTQIFYDKTGTEISRHEGYMDEQTIKNIIDPLIAN